MIRIQAIGAIDAHVGRTRVGQDSELQFALVLFLGLTAGRRIARSALLEKFWPDTDDAHSRHALRQLLYRLRKEGLVLALDGEELLLAPELVACDLSEMLDPTWPERASDADVLEMGPVLPEYAPQLPNLFRDWIDELRARAAAQLRRAVFGRMIAARRDGRWTDVHRWSRQCLTIDPLNEEATLAMAEATAMAGGKVEALQILDGYLAELGDKSRQLELPATILRRRVSEQLTDIPSGSAFEQLLVGRDNEMRELLTYLAKTRASHGGCLEILGPPGIGKSRLAAELMRDAALRGFAHCTVRLHSTDLGRPFAVFLDLVPQLSATPGAAGCAPESVTTLRRLTEHDQRGAAFKDETEIEVRLHQIREAIFDLLAAVADEGPLLVLVDDAQYIDSASRALLNDLMRWSSAQRVLWLLTRRPVEPAPAATHPFERIAAIELGALSEDACRTLIAVAIKSISDSDRDRLAIVCKSIGGGNPFFVREILANWDTSRRFDSLPESIAQAVSRRVAGLSGSALRALQCSALLGGLATVGRVNRVLRDGIAESLDAMTELDRAGIANVRDGESGLLLHGLWRDEVTRIIRPATAQMMHSRIADVLESEGQPRRLAALLWEAARHRALAGEPDRAVAMLEDCAEHLLAIGSPEDAAETWARAEALCGSDVDRLRCLGHRIRALDAGGKWESFSQLIPRVHELALRTNPMYDCHDEFELMADELQWRRDADPFECRARAITCSELRTASIEHRLRALRLRAAIDDNICDDADLKLSHALARKLTFNRPEYLRHHLSLSVIYHTACGDLHEARNAAHELIATDRDRGAAKSLCASLRMITFPLRVLGDFDGSREFLREALEIAEKYCFTADATAVCDILATIAIEQGDLADARLWVERATYWAREVDANLHRFASKLLRAQLALAHGRFEEVLALLEPELDGRSRHPVPRVTLNVASTLTGAYVALGRTADVARSVPIIHDCLTRTAARGRQDEYFRALASGLTHLGKFEAAKTVIREYVETRRRDQSPVPKALQEILSRG